MEITNEKLASLNQISEKKFQSMSLEFRQHTQTLLTMKKQLDSCFRRIRLLKSKLATQYPEAYKGEELRQALEDHSEPQIHNNTLGPALLGSNISTA